MKDIYKSPKKNNENNTEPALRQAQGPEAQRPKIWALIVAIAAFAVITLVYFYPVLQGKRIKQHDIEMHMGMAKEITDYHEATGDRTLWTNSAFGGMPTWNISVSQNANLTSPIYKGRPIFSS